MRSSKVLILLFVAVLALAACGGGDTPAAEDDAPEETTEAGAGEEEPEDDAGGEGGDVTVTAANFAFSPDELTLEAGQEVSLTFVNADSAPHTFTAEDVGIDVKADAGSEATGTFTAPDSGSVDFKCLIHPAMTGTITVGGGSAQGADKSKDSEMNGGGGKYDY
jgi:plastocyanin